MVYVDKLLISRYCYCTHKKQNKIEKEGVLSMLFVYLVGCATTVPVSSEVIEEVEETHEISEPTDQEVFEEEDFQNSSYAMLMVVGREIQDPSPLGSSWGKQQTTSIALLSWSRNDTDVEYMETHCALSTTDDFGTVYNYSDTYLEAISDRTRIGELSSTRGELLLL